MKRSLWFGWLLVVLLVGTVLIDNMLPRSQALDDATAPTVAAQAGRPRSIKKAGPAQALQLTGCESRVCPLAKLTDEMSSSCESADYVCERCSDGELVIVNHENCDLTGFIACAECTSSESGPCFAPAFRKKGLHVNKINRIRTYTPSGFTTTFNQRNLRFELESGTLAYAKAVICNVTQTSRGNFASRAYGAEAELTNAEKASATDCDRIWQDDATNPALVAVRQSGNPLGAVFFIRMDSLQDQ